MRSFVRRRVFLLSWMAILALGIWTMAPVAWGQIPETARYGGTLRIGVKEDILSLDPRYRSPGGNVSYGIQQLWETVAQYSPDGMREKVPWLAESWQRLDATTFLVRLRRGVQFHHGREMTAEDVKANFDWSLKLPKGWRPLFSDTYAEPIRAVEVVDRYTLRFTTKAPYAPFEVLLSPRVVRGVIPPEYAEANPRGSDRPVGTGPFRFVEWVRGDHVTVERNPNYWGKRPYLERVIFRVIKDDETRLLALQKGEFDIAQLEPAASQILRGDPQVTFYRVPNPERITQLTFNLRRWPMNDLRFRRAIAMGVRWDQVVARGYPFGLGIPARSWLAGSWAHEPADERLYPAYAPAKAKQLLAQVEAEAGRKIPPLFALSIDREHYINKMTMIQAEMRQLGLVLKFEAYPYMIYSQKSRKDPKVPWDLMIVSPQGAVEDPYYSLENFRWMSGQGGDGNNSAAYRNERLEQIFATVFAQRSREERKRLYREANQILMQDLPSIPLDLNVYFFGVRKRVHGFQPHESGYIYLVSPWTNIWIEGEKR